MRIIYFDIDSLRPDHLGCYGYHRNTSPNIDAIANEGIRFTNCYTSDAPCAPSRNALLTGQFGIHNGLIAHSDTAGDLFKEGKGRWFFSQLGDSCWANQFRKAGLKTVTISPFAERHSSYQWYAGFNEMYNTGGIGEEGAEEIMPIAKDWLQRNAKNDNWFLHINLWDPHTPYRVPEEYGEPFKEDPLPEWYTEEVRQKHWKGAGSWSAQEGLGYGEEHPYNNPEKYPRQPSQISSIEEARKMFDGYDTGIKYADDHIKMILDELKKQNVFEETTIIITADHGENLGELNIYYDHQTADYVTPRVPYIIKWPGITEELKGKRFDALHYQFDLGATLVEFAGSKTPNNWDAKSNAVSIKKLSDEGRDYLVLSQGAHTCQRSVRFSDYICIRSYHDGYHNYPDFMLFNIKDDPHEQRNLAEEKPELVDKAMRYLEEWHGEMMRSAKHPHDPMWFVINEGGPMHTRFGLKEYIQRLKDTGREDQAKLMLTKHPEILEIE
ncbi:MAG: sulfatase [Melioribacteraceae bacterium]|nr:sulfatase [Melioribacteraceae bacterium]